MNQTAWSTLCQHLGREWAAITVLKAAELPASRFTQSNAPTVDLRRAAYVGGIVKKLKRGKDISVMASWKRHVKLKQAGSLSVAMIRDLKGVIQREKAPIAVFMTLVPATKPMLAEAASAGFYTLEERQYPRLQIITIDDALRGKKPARPLIDLGAAFKKPRREPTGSQSALDF
jgi:hypothetical protein